MESDNFIEHYIIRLLSGHEVVLPPPPPPPPPDIWLLVDTCNLGRMYFRHESLTPVWVNPVWVSVSVFQQCLKCLFLPL